MRLPHFLSLTTHLTAVASLVLFSACDGGGDDTGPALEAGDAQVLADEDAGLTKRATTAATTNTLTVGATVPGFPHLVDVYRPSGATKAIVFLHGHGGRNWQMAYDMGVNRAMQPAKASNVDWDWLSRNGVIAVFPQGQSKLPPPVGLPTWSNYVFESGQDDVAFLTALSAFVRTQYGATSVLLSGHSSGGSMTARMWCEGTPAYKAYFSIAGPMASSTRPIPSATCTPLAPAPYYMIVGGSDTKLSAFAPDFFPPTAEQIAAGLTDTVLTYEWTRHEGRAMGVCGEQPVLNASTKATTGPTWNACNGLVRYQVVTKADHPIASLEQYAGIRMRDLANAFPK